MDVRLLWLALGAFAGSVESSLILGTLPAISAESGVTIAQAGYLVFAYSIAYGIGTPILTTILGGVDRRTVVASAEFAFGCMAVLFGLLPGFVLILVARTLLSMGAGLFTSTAQSTAVALAAPGRRGQAISTVVMGGTIAVAVGAPLATLAAQIYGWRAAYVGLGLLAISAAVIMRLRLPGDIHGDKRTLRDRLAVIAVPGMSAALLTSCLASFGSFALLIYIAPVTTDYLHLDKGLIPLVLFAFGLGAVGGNHIGGYLSDRIGARRTTLLNLCVMTLALAAVEFVPLLPAPLVPPAFLACNLVLGVVCWGFLPPQLIRLANLAPHSMALSTSLNLTAMNIGGAFSALTGGYVLEHFGVGYVGWCAATISAAALAVAYLSSARSEVPVAA